MNPDYSRIRQPRSPQWLLALVLSLPLVASALPDDREQPIHIEADRAELDQRRGITTYEGDVRMRQGSMRIEADKVIIHTNEANDVERVEAHGSPAHLQQRRDPERGPMHARADAIDYDVAREQVLLLRNASLEQDGSTMSGNRINYNMLEDLVNITGERDSDSPRVEMVIPPRTRTPAED
ncbi:lipopolysaccharide transport periplasmic protein LptA [Marinimicrobium alkaliphilum]|uniref:lipopolysaccharide transport periplasmic protein LptA n=1 Tax=Marinimicrobium alkaliphilum TaxID=2202654 RepID=UPI001300BCF0|nr:lipopolysaccharide transport periplasmic protein LptA [Marinimicrobium alkaliphilum]